MQTELHRGETNAKGFRFAIALSRWNDELTSRLLEGALDAFESSGLDRSDVEVFRVPGAFELPLAAQKAAQTGRFDAVVALGVVIRGDTPHFDFVAGEAARGILQVGLNTGVPVMFGVITADTTQQAVDRCGTKSENKGFEAAMSAIEVAILYKNMGRADEEIGSGRKGFSHVV